MSQEASAATPLASSPSNGTPPTPEPITPQPAPRLMKTPKFLIDPNFLAQLDRALLTEFLGQFDLGPAGKPLLDPALPPPEFCSGLSALLASPQNLPGPMCDALRAIEDLAAPENKERLDHALYHAPLSLGIDPHSHPLQQALKLWLYRPFDPPPLPAARAGQASPQAPSQSQSEAPLPASQPPVTLVSSGPESTAPAPGQARPGLHLRLSVLFYEIHPLVRHQFFARFEPELREAFPELPQLPDPPSSTDDFDDAVYQLLDDPAFLPEPMRDALIAIQELAAPPNRHLLRGLILQSNLDREPADTPDQLALRFWLRHPFTPGGLEPLRAQLPSHLRAPVPRKDNGHNGETQTAELDLDLPAPPPAPQPPALRPGDLAAIARFPRNKISKLPPDVREEINQLIRRRVAYKDIVARVGPRAPGLNASNLSRWKKTGYLLWLADQQRREDAEAQIQLLFDLVRENDNGKLHEATQQIAALRISQVLAAFDTASLTQSLQQHPQAFVRLVQTLPGLSRGGMDCERLLVELAERKAALQPNNERKRGISQPTLQYMQEKLNLM